MLTLQIGDDVTVAVGESDASKNIIKTNYTGPCLAFLMDFEFDGTNVCTLFHYSAFINEEKCETQSKLLVQALEYIDGELQHCLGLTGYKSNGKPRLSNMNLLIAGGDIDKSKRIENALCMLNSVENNFNIKNETADEDVHFIYNELINKVCIVNPATKILSDKEEDDGEITDEANDYPYVRLEYSCATKNIIIHIMWYLTDPHVEIGTLQFKLMSQQMSQAEWQLNEEIINNLKISYEHDEPKQERLQQALALIPKYPFLILPDLTKYTSSSQAASINLYRGGVGDSDCPVDSDNPNKESIQTSINMTSMLSNYMSSSSISTDPNETI